PGEIDSSNWPVNGVVFDSVVFGPLVLDSNQTLLGVILEGPLVPERVPSLDNLVVSAITVSRFISTTVHKPRNIPFRIALILLDADGMTLIIQLSDSLQSSGSVVVISDARSGRLVPEFDQLPFVIVPIEGACSAGTGYRFHLPGGVPLDARGVSGGVPEFDDISPRAVLELSRGSKGIDRSQEMPEIVVLPAPAGARLVFEHYWLGCVVVFNPAERAVLLYHLDTVVQIVVAVAPLSPNLVLFQKQLARLPVFVFPDSALGV